MANRDAVGLAGTRALQFAKRAAFRKAFHMVVVAFLGASHVLFEAQHLGAVLAERAVHGGVPPQHLLDPFLEGVHHECVVAQIARREKLHLGMIGSHQLGVLADSAHQNP